MNYAIILAGGKGLRMNTLKPKCLVDLLGKPMLEYLIDELEKLSFNKKLCVVGYKKEMIKNLFGKRLEYVNQYLPLGTADALKCAKKFIDNNGYSVVLLGDSPLIEASLINKLINKHKKENNDLTICTTYLKKPKGFGRIIRNNNKIVDIVEDINLNQSQKNIKEINTGLMCINNEIIHRYLYSIKKSKTGEYYLTDLIKLISKNKKIGSLKSNDPFSLSGINDLLELKKIEGRLQGKINRSFILNGVNLINPSSIIISRDSIIKRGTTILPNCYINKSIIKENCVIGPNTEISNSIINNCSNINNSVIKDSVVNDFSNVGPFTSIKKNSVIGKYNRIGSFVEIKSTSLGYNTKAAHLAYIGDTICGNNVNFGCGFVTANYDGIKKHKTIIGDNAFIGCNVNLIAPIKIGNNTFVAAGSTVRRNILDNNFLIEKGETKIKRSRFKK